MGRLSLQVFGCRQSIIRMYCTCPCGVANGDKFVPMQVNLRPTRKARHFTCYCHASHVIVSDLRVNIVNTWIFLESNCLNGIDLPISQSHASATFPRTTWRVSLVPTHSALAGSEPLSNIKKEDPSRLNTRCLQRCYRPDGSRW